MFGGRSDVVGQTVMMSGEAYTIVGVMPPGFDFPSRDYRLWVPAALQGGLFQRYPDAHFLRTLGRLKTGIGDARLQTEIDTLAKRVDPDDTGPGRHYYSVGLKEAMNGELRRPLIVLLLAVGFLLVIACANVANLMLARASVRQREMAVRGALGASRGRLMRQLLTESTLLALTGGALGLILSVAGLRFLTAFGSKSVPQLVHASIDVWALGFAFLVSAATGVLSGLVPALTASRNDFHTDLKEGARSTQGAAANRWRSGLVFAEIAMAALLLVCCGLMVRSFVSLSNVNPGFRPEGLVSAGVAHPDKTYPEASNILLSYRRALADLRALPGVTAVGMITHLPFGGNGWGNSFEVEGRPASPGRGYVAQIRPSSPDYFRAMGIPLKQGRDFAGTDSEKAPGVAIINEVLAKRFWANESPLGKRLRFDTNWLTIIGVCGDIKHIKLDSASDPEIYLAYPQLSPFLMKFVGRDNYYVVRSSTAGVGSAVRATLRALDPEIVVKVNTMEHLIGDSIAQPRFRTWLITCFALIALALACLGIYGVISYVVSQRLREMGLRIALGARRLDIVREVLARAARLAGAGIAAGLVAAFFLSRFLGSLLFGISAHDAVTYTWAAVLLFGVALLASYVPASRAARTDPTIALRSE
jgi:putative ABC transport system permease protein